MVATLDRAKLWDEVDGLVAQSRHDDPVLEERIRSDLAELRYVQGESVASTCADCGHSPQAHAEAKRDHHPSFCEECMSASLPAYNYNHPFRRGQDGIDGPEPARGTVSDAGSNPAGSTNLFTVTAEVADPNHSGYVGEPCPECGVMALARDGTNFLCHHCGAEA